MANAGLGTDVLILDTAATIYAAGKPVYIKKIVFFPAVADDDLDVTDGNGTPIMQVRAAAGGTTNKNSYANIEANFEKWFDGLILVTIDNAASGSEIHVFLG